jgi:hypothetical protein
MSRRQATYGPSVTSGSRRGETLRHVVSSRSMLSGGSMSTQNPLDSKNIVNANGRSKQSRPIGSRRINLCDCERSQARLPVERCIKTPSELEK